MEKLEKENFNDYEDTARFINNLEINKEKNELFNIVGNENINELLLGGAPKKHEKVIYSILAIRENAINGEKQEIKNKTIRP